MRHIIDRFDLPEEIKCKYSHYPRESGRESNPYIKDCAYTYVFVCKECGLEAYSEFKYQTIYIHSKVYKLEEKLKYASSENERNSISRQIEELKREAKELSEYEKLAAECYYASLHDAVCPICGAKLLQEKGYFYPDTEIYYDENKRLDFWGMKNQAEKLYGLFISRSSKCTVDDKFRQMENVRKKIKKEKTDELLNTKIQSYDIFVASGASPIASTVKRDCESLKGYLLNLIRLENNIYSLQQLLPNLYHRRLENDPVVVFEAYSPVYSEWEELKELRETHHDALESIQRAKTYQPVIDIDYPIEPSAPLLKKPGLFNKQKVLAENEAMTKQYQMAMDSYRKEVLRCDEEKNRLIAEKRNAALKKAMKMEADAKAALATAEAGLNEKRAALKEQVTPAKVTKYILDQEITAAEELLQKTYAARNELYAYDIVFDKYRNPVALSSFYEYLMSGRCSALEGADGAYNIYESEIRANRVIAQLDAVVSSLEDIKHNQYMMYREMCRTNSLLENLNSTMDQALTSIQGIEANTSKIAENSAVIAHNSAITAYYSKVNAELTNALGFMMAYK